jgi:hypothetical protein
MTPAVVLICVAAVTNVNHGTVVNKNCDYVQVNPAGSPAFPEEKIAVNTVQQPAVGVNALAVVDVLPNVAPEKPKVNKPLKRNAKIHIRSKTAPVMTASQDKAFRLNWFKRLAGLAKETN